MNAGPTHLQSDQRLEYFTCFLSIYFFRDPKGGEKELIQDFSYFKIQAAFDAQIDRYPLLNTDR